MTPRELVVLVNELPSDSRFKRGHSSSWTLTERLIAASINLQHSLREDYRSAHDADYHFTPVEAPELERDRRAREAQERAAQHRNQLARTALDRILSGELQMTDIDVTKPIEEALIS
ncbi:hypothetical protein [Nocardia sp. NPDC046763]|uniref:hypothetical protein n=1 Tax=Nocardia sp. NPDC046763 TaxID=3155256 RepID=UPI0033C7FEC2